MINSYEQMTVCVCVCLYVFVAVSRSMLTVYFCVIFVLGVLLIAVTYSTLESMSYITFTLNQFKGLSLDMPDIIMGLDRVTLTPSPQSTGTQRAGHS